MEISSIALGVTILFNMVYMLYSIRRDDNDLYNIYKSMYDDYDDEVVFEYSVVDDSNDIWFELNE